MSLKFATFGCWNEGCIKESVQYLVIRKLIELQDQYKFLIILGDNYYSKKKSIDIQNSENVDDIKSIKYSDINLQEMKKGFECLEDITIPKKMIFGNHDIEDGTLQGCSNMKSQLKIPWIDIKFPYDFENYYIFLENEDPKLNNYKIVKFIYLDTTVYDLVDKTNTCYDKVINKSPSQIIEEQTIFITEQLKSLNPTYTNTVIFIGHEPLITFRFKTNKIGKTKNPKILSLLNDIYELTKGLHEIYNFHYICADFHNFEESIITKEYDTTGKSFKIHQLVFGTGGVSKLDPRYNPTSERINPDNFNGFNYNMQNRYSSDEDVQDYSMPHINSNGYGEITIDKDGLKYKFYPIVQDTMIDFKNKYLKYKKKYLEIKKNIVSLN